MKIECKEIGFFTSNGFFEIYDNRGVLFYSSNFTLLGKSGKPVKFSLPIGVYNVTGIIEKTKPFKINLPNLPKIERLKKHGSFNLSFDENPNKCTINYKNRTIIFDNKFKTYPSYVLFFILYHEYGHLLYSSEFKADCAAVYIMLLKGFNKSQIGLAPFETLTQNESFKRKLNVVKILSKL